MKKIKEGISLIVLVITIIVMIILAAAIIISLNNTGIIGSANKAVNDTNEKTVQEIANLAWGEAYASGVRDEEGLKSAVEKALLDNGLNKEEYGMEVNQKGVDIAKGWIKTKDNKVVKGTQVLKIGDLVQYDETKGGTNTVPKDVNWAVLGAEDGKVLIVSVSNIGDKTFNEEQTLEGAMNAYTNGINELNNMCAIYGKGIGAKYARSIKVEDIDKITGYDKTTYSYSYIKYGDTHTFYWDNTVGKESNPYYESTKTSHNGNLSTEHLKFLANDGNTWHLENKPDSLTSKKKIAEITENHYSYYIKDMIDTKDKAYIMLFDTTNGAYSYWLANNNCLMATTTNLNSVLYGFKSAFYDKIGENYVARVGSRWIVTSDTQNVQSTNGVRAVVAIEDNITFKGSSDTGWNLE